MVDRASVDQKFLDQAKQDANQTRIYGLLFLLSGALIQLFHIPNVAIRGFPIMVIIAGVILGGAGVLFILGSMTVPKTRSEFIKRLQKIMVDTNPERRLWAAQRLVGYAKEAEFSRKEVLALATHAVNVVKKPPVKAPYDIYVAGDHIILLREIAVSVPMTKHVRKEFVSLLKPLQNLKTLEDKPREILAEAIVYHPGKLPIHAYYDLKTDETE